MLFYISFGLIRGLLNKKEEIFFFVLWFFWFFFLIKKVYSLIGNLIMFQNGGVISLVLFKGGNIFFGSSVISCSIGFLNFLFVFSRGIFSLKIYGGNILYFLGKKLFYFSIFFFFNFFKGKFSFGSIVSQYLWFKYKDFIFIQDFYLSYLFSFYYLNYIGCFFRFNSLIFFLFLDWFFSLGFGLYLKYFILNNFKYKKSISGYFLESINFGFYVSNNKIDTEIVNDKFCYDIYNSNKVDKFDIDLKQYYFAGENLLLYLNNFFILLYGNVEWDFFISYFDGINYLGFKFGIYNFSSLYRKIYGFDFLYCNSLWNESNYFGNNVFFQGNFFRWKKLKKFSGKKEKFLSWLAEEVMPYNKRYFKKLFLYSEGKYTTPVLQRYVKKQNIFLFYNNFEILSLKKILGGYLFFINFKYFIFYSFNKIIFGFFLFNFLIINYLKRWILFFFNKFSCYFFFLVWNYIFILFFSLNIFRSSNYFFRFFYNILIYFINLNSSLGLEDLKFLIIFFKKFIFSFRFFKVGLLFGYISILDFSFFYETFQLKKKILKGKFQKINLKYKFIKKKKLKILNKVNKNFYFPCIFFFKKSYIFGGDYTIRGYFFNPIMVLLGVEGFFDFYDFLKIMVIFYIFNNGFYRLFLLILLPLFRFFLSFGNYWGFNKNNQIVLDEDLSLKNKNIPFRLMYNYFYGGALMEKKETIAEKDGTPEVGFMVGVIWAGNLVKYGINVKDMYSRVKGKNSFFYGDFFFIFSYFFFFSLYNSKFFLWSFFLSNKDKFFYYIWNYSLHLRYVNFYKAEFFVMFSWKNLYNNEYHLDNTFDGGLFLDTTKRDNVFLKKFKLKRFYVNYYNIILEYIGGFNTSCILNIYRYFFFYYYFFNLKLIFNFFIKFAFCNLDILYSGFFNFNNFNLLNLYFFLFLDHGFYNNYNYNYNIKSLGFFEIYSKFKFKLSFLGYFIKFFLLSSNSLNFNFSLDLLQVGLIFNFSFFMKKFGLNSFVKFSSLYESGIGTMGFINLFYDFWFQKSRFGLNNLLLPSSNNNNVHRFWEGFLFLKIIFFLGLFIRYWNRLPGFLFYSSFWSNMDNFFSELYKFLPNSWFVSGMWWPGTLTNFGEVTVVTGDPKYIESEYFFKRYKFGLGKKFYNLLFGKHYDNIFSFFSKWGVFQWRGPEIVFINVGEDSVIALREFLVFSVPLYVVLNKTYYFDMNASLVWSDLVYWILVDLFFFERSEYFYNYFFFFWFCKFLLSLQYMGFFIGGNGRYLGGGSFVNYNRGFGSNVRKNMFLIYFLNNNYKFEKKKLL